MGGQELSTNPQQRQAQVQAQNQQQNTPLTVGAGNVANSAVAGNAQAQAQILSNALQAVPQNISLAKAGDLQAINTLIAVPDFQTNLPAQQAAAYGILRNAGYNPTDALIQNLLNGVQINGKSPTGGVSYGVNLSESLPVSDALNNLKKANLSIGDNLGLSDTVSAIKNVQNANSLVGFANQGQANNQNTINQINSQIANLKQVAQQTEQQYVTDHGPTGKEFSYYATVPTQDALAAQSQIQSLTEQLGKISNANSFLSSLEGVGSNVLSQAQQKAQQAAQKLVTGSVLNNPLGQFLPQAFAQQQGRQFNVDLTESLGLQNQPQKGGELLQGIGGPNQDPFGNPNEATEGFGKGTGFVSLSPSDLLGGNKENINRINSDITNLSNTPGLTSITADFGNGNKKTYPVQQALGGILTDLTTLENNAPKDVSSNFGLNLTGNFAPVTVPLTQQQRQQQQQSFQQSQSDLLGNLANAKSKGITSLDILNSQGQKIGTTNPQDTTKARYDILKASLLGGGPVSVKGITSSETTTSSGIGLSPNGGKNVDLSLMRYADEVDAGITKPQNFADQLKYYGSVAERSAGSLGSSLYNYISKNVNPNADLIPATPPTFYSNLFSIFPAGTKKLENLGVQKALGIPSDTSQDTRKPSDIFAQGILSASKELKTDPLKVLAETPGFAGDLILFGKGGNLAETAGNKIAGRLSNAASAKEINKFVNTLQIPKETTIEVKPPPNEITGKVNPNGIDTGFFSDTIKVENPLPKVHLDKSLETPEFYAEPVKNSKGLYEIKTPTTDENQPLITMQKVINPSGKPDIQIDVFTKNLNPKPTSVSIAGDIGTAEADLFGTPIKNEGVIPSTSVSISPPGISPSIDVMRNFQSAFLVPDYLKPLGTRETFLASQLRGKEQDFAYYLLGKTRKEGVVAPMLPYDEMLLTESKNFGKIEEPKSEGSTIEELFNPKNRISVKARKYASKIIPSPIKGLFAEDVFNPIEPQYVKEAEGAKITKRTSTFDIDVNKFLNPETLQSIANRPMGKGKSFTKGKFSLADNPLGNLAGEDVSEEVKSRYPLMSGLTHEKALDIQKALTPKEEKTTKPITITYPYTQKRNHNDEFDILAYPPGTPEHITRQKSILNQFSQAEKTGELVSLGGESKQKGGHGTKIINQFDIDKILGSSERTKTRGSSSLNLKLGTLPMIGQTQRTNTDVTQILVPGQTTTTKQGTDTSFKYQYKTEQKQKQQNQFTDTFNFTTPPRPKVPPPELTFQGGWPNIYGLISPKKKHGSRSIGSFFTYSVNPNKPGDIADVNYSAGKYVGTKPINLKFGGGMKLDNLLGTSKYSKSRRKNSLSF